MIENPQKDVELQTLGAEMHWGWCVLGGVGFIAGIMTLGWMYGTILSRIVGGP